MNIEGNQYDICPECYKSLEGWFDDPKKEGDADGANRSDYEPDK